MAGMRPVRKRLPHEVPSWVPDGAVYFLTLCARQRGGDVLPARADVLLGAATAYHDMGRWHLHLFVLMPDHVHMLAVFPVEPGMRKTVASWKSFTARHGRFHWQTDFFEHRLRSDESMEEKAHYIRMNPVRAGLCVDWQDWPHRWPR
jgi:REP element-mobilizing transposase RayT